MLRPNMSKNVHRSLVSLQGIISFLIIAEFPSSNNGLSRTEGHKYFQTGDT